ncbi:hypothetical protein IU469_31925 [Nocardia puris]|uniref:Uncharacterized protein n=1 Tax=Nocardia puris TaxID=208602 RepID=A0A366CUH3_9NOCA|nr:hypothetical protein [Nocardia puris]MBF6370281.1 hypothetical protein [Nocardia puris]RBO79954.1 hypothetical protein DFR74_12930 [Nocardia puris]
MDSDPVIDSAVALLRWIEKCLPACDPERFHPWRTDPEVPGALTADIHLTVRSAGRPDRHLDLRLCAHPITDP